MEFIEALNRASQVLKDAQPFQVITHGDVDGVAAGALAVSAFDCEVRIQKRLDLKTIDRSQFTLFLDLGSSQLQEIEKGFTSYFVVDHHPGEYGEHVLNPWMYNIDGTRFLSAAATLYLVVKQLGPDYNRLSYLGLIGALGDRQVLERENNQLLEDAVDSGVLSGDVLFNAYDLYEVVDVVNACCRNSKKELALSVCLLQNYQAGRKELKKYTRIFQKDMNYLISRWDTIEEENKGRAAYFVYDDKITKKYAGELATALARTYRKTVIILVNDTEGIKISGRSVPELVQNGVHLGAAFKGFGGGHDIAAGAFLKDENDIKPFIQVVNERLYTVPVTVTLDIPITDAEKVMKVLAVDNKGYENINIKAEDNCITATVEGNPGTVKNITDDIIACIISVMHMMEED